MKKIDLKQRTYLQNFLLAISLNPKVIFLLTD